MGNTEKTNEIKREKYTIFNGKLAGKLMVKGFVLISMGKKYCKDDKDDKDDKYKNTYNFNKTENLMRAVAELTDNVYRQ